MNYSLDSIKTLTRRFQYGTRLRPTRDWFVLIALASVVLLVCVAWSALAFEQTLPGVPTARTIVSAGVTVNHDALARMQQLFATRATEETKYESGAYTLTDPSR